MSDHETRLEAFFVALGSCLDTARQAELVVVLELEDGTTIEGVPRESADARAGDAEIDDTGTRSYLELDGRLVMLARVRRYSLAVPD